jgi:DNA polymerase V
VFALVDANNFYCSAEMCLRPSLRGRPLVVLSNNDGAAIARSEEAKALGVKMGQPFFEFRHLEESAGLLALSANFALYGDISDRVMSLAAGMGPEQEIYSIDESWIGLGGVRGDLADRARAVRERILQWVGIPCCVGIAPTKTLAKFANHVAKNAERKPGSYPAEFAQVCDLSKMPRIDVEALLAATEVGEVWGVGRRIGAQLLEAGVKTALDLAKMDPVVAARRWSVVMERTVRELQGTPCMPLEDASASRKQIAVTRSFGAPVEDLRSLGEAVTGFAAKAAEKLRKQEGKAGSILVFIRTSPFRKDPQYSRSIVVPLRRPSSDNAAIVGAAIAGLRAIHAPGYKLAKAGVMLLDLQDASVDQFELDLGEPSKARDADRLMAAVDTVNDRWGQGALTVGSAKIGGAKRDWEARQNRKTPAYTTCWDDMPIARA